MLAITAAAIIGQVDSKIVHFLVNYNVCSCILFLYIDDMFTIVLLVLYTNFCKCSLSNFQNVIQFISEISARHYPLKLCPHQFDGIKVWVIRLKPQNNMSFFFRNVIYNILRFRFIRLCQSKQFRAQQLLIKRYIMFC